MGYSISIACDHGGYAAKDTLVTWLEQAGHAVTDYGTDSEEIVRYPYYAARVAADVSRGDAQRGVLICSTGIGMSIAANKYPGVRAALCTDGYMARLTREHNDSNILCLGGKITGIYTLIDILDIWLRTEYTGGRHDISLALIRRMEEAQMQGALWTEETPAK